MNFGLSQGQPPGDIILDLADRLLARDAARLQAEPQPKPVDERGNAKRDVVGFSR